MIIKKNTICYTSILGHRDFHYPTNKKAVVKDSCQVQKMSWVGGNGQKIAVKIHRHNLLPLDPIECVKFHNLRHIKNNNEYVIVWIPLENL